MNKTSAKMMAVVVTALFCVSAIAAVFVSDDSSAASTTHKVYIEIVGDDGLVTSTQWFAFESDGTAQGFATSATAAAAKYGLNDVSFTYSEDYGGSISANYTGGYGSACYIVKDGAWATSQNTAEEYPAAGVLGFALNYGYITKTIYDGLTDAQKQKFAETGFGDDWYAMKILDAAPSAAPAIVTYHIFAQHFDSNYKVDKSAWISFDSLQEVNSFVANANAAFKDNGWEKAVLTYTGSYVSMSYDGSGSNSSDYAKDGEWKHVTDSATQYVENTTLSMAFGGYITNAVYDTLSDAEKENWVFDFEYGTTKYYYSKTTESINGWEENKGNMTLYIVIGAVAVVALLVVLFFVFKKH